MKGRRVYSIVFDDKQIEQLMAVLGGAQQAAEEMREKSVAMDIARIRACIQDALT